MTTTRQASAHVVHVLATKRHEAGGGGEHLLRIIPGLLMHGFRSTVVVGAEGPIARQFRDARIPVVPLGPMGVGSPWRLRRALSALRPDLLHLHGSRAGFLGVLTAPSGGAHPVIYTAHAFSFRRRLPPPLPWVLAQMEAFICGRAKRVICLAEGDREEARRHGIPMHRAIVIPNGVDASRFDASADRRGEFGFAPGDPVVGMVARLVPQKDPLTFLAVARRLIEMEPGSRFLLVGDGPMRERVARAARALGLDGRLVITGFRADVPALLRTMDVVLLTSRWEGLPIALLEAMAAGRPAVASRLPGTSEIIVDGVTGFLVPPGDVEGFAGSVRKLLGDRALREALGRAGRERVAREFSLAKTIEATAQVYADALAE